METKLRGTARNLGLALLIASFMTPAGAAVFNNNFDADPSASVTLLGTAEWRPAGGASGGYISLTDNVNSQQGTILIEDFSNGTTVAGFLATFKMRLGDGTGNAADGWSFNFAEDLPDGTTGEAGHGTGLTVSFDIYVNSDAGETSPTVRVRVGGAQVYSKDFAKADLLSQDFADVRIELRNGLLNVNFKGQSIYDSVVVALPPIAGGRFSVGARTGGENVTHWIDDLRIETFQQTTPAIAAVPANAKGVTVVLQDAPGAAVDASSVTATVDGAAVTGTAVKTGDKTLYTYTHPELFAPGSTHAVVLSYKYGAAGTSGSTTLTVTTPNYQVVPASAALSASTVGTTRGFIWRIHHADVDGTLPNRVQRANDQLAGMHGPNIADATAVGAASANGTPASPGTAPIEFKVPGVINFSQYEGDELGNFTPDLQMPGVWPGDPNNLAAEILTALEFPVAGTYTLIVNSDDGFQTSAGINPRDVTNPTLGIFNDGRGASDTAYHVHIEAPGLYGFRTVWFEGNGGANIEWLSVMPDGTKVLLNDTAAHAQAIKAYQLNTSALPAFVQSVNPGVASSSIVSPIALEAVLVDAGTQITASSASLKLNGATVPVTATKTGNTTRVVTAPGSPLQSSTPYSAELTFTDSAGSRTVSWSFTTGPLSTTLFVIEAEDFDYDGGLHNPQMGTPGMDVDVMPYYGGAYEGLGAIHLVDYRNADNPVDGTRYRELDDTGWIAMYQSDNVAGGNGLGGTLSINGSDRGTYTTTRNYNIGWAGSPDWQNYTRNFPNNGMGGWWKVFALLSYGDTQPGQLSGTLSVVTAGIGTQDQELSEAGRFNAPGSGGWGANNLVPMKNATGGDALVKLMNKQTVRYSIGSGDVNALIFSAAPPPPPFLESVTRDSSKRDEVAMEWTLRDADAQVNASSVRVFFDGEDVTSKATATKTATGAAVQLDLSGTMFAAGEHAWRVTYTDTAGQNGAAEGTYLVNPYPTEGVFVIEAEDYNFEGGNTLPVASVMPYLGGAYEDLLGIYNIDYVNNDGNDNGGEGTVGSDAYRHEGMPVPPVNPQHVNIAASNGNRYSNDRGTFEVESNYRIGWVANGEWHNYTRTFPKGDYNVWAALSHGELGAGQLRSSLDLVTSDATKPNQTVQALGTFSGPGTGGWGRNELVPMKDTTGKMVVLPMEGVQTVRFNLGSGDFDYFLFVPATAGPDPGDAPRFTRIQRVGGGIVLEWTGGGVLETAPTINGPWTPVSNASSPYTLTPTQQAQFGRIRR